MDWNLTWDSVAMQRYSEYLSKEIKFSQNDRYIGFNWGNRLDIKEIHGQKIESHFSVNQSDTCICGFDISENFDTVAYYDSNHNIYFYNLKNTATPISAFREPNTIKSIKFITQKTGKGFLAVETLYSIKFYDAFTCTLKNTYMIKDKTESRFKSFCGLSINDGFYAAFSSMAENGH